MADPMPKLRQPAEGREGKRPMGPLLILGLALLLVLVLSKWSQPSRDITEDRFWYELYRGNVKELRVQPPSRIAGSLADAGDPAVPARFQVTVPDTTEVHEELRRLSARRLEKPALGLLSFLRDVELGVKRPLTGYAVTAQLPPASAAEGGEPLTRQHFFAEYADASGLHYAEVVGTDNEALDVLALAQALQEKGAAVETRSFDLVGGLATEESNPMLVYFLTTFGPILLFGMLVWFLFLRQMRGQGQSLLSFGRSRAVLYSKEKRTGITFEDVAGIDEAKDEVREIIEFLRNPTKFQRLGGRIPRGVLLVGPPGTGKTLLAKAIAGEADVPFLSISGSDFVEMFVGVGASRVRDLFKQAKESAPCIVFLDEIDAVGRKRGTGLGGGHDEREQTLNAILVEMDGFSTDEGIIVCAATNRPDVLDPALLRPGRFDREIVIDLPDLRGREKILQVHTRKVKVAKDVELGTIARGTPGFSGAELAALVNEAAIAAAMHERDAVAQRDFEEARDKVRFGREKKSRVMDPEDKRIVACHEAGHAVVSALLEHTEPLHKVTIIPRGMALGATMSLPEKEQTHLRRKKVEAELAVLYGGRVAEQTFCNDITAGAANDILRATHIARLMVTEWGMSERLGPVNLSDRRGSDFLGAEISIGRDHSEETVREVDEEVRRLLREAHDRAAAVIEEHRDAVERVAEALLRYETLQGEEVYRLVRGGTVDDLRREPAAQPAPEAAPKTRPEPLPAPGALRPGTLPRPRPEGLSPA